MLAVSQHREHPQGCKSSKLLVKTLAKHCSRVTNTTTQLGYHEQQQKNNKKTVLVDWLIILDVIHI